MHILLTYPDFIVNWQATSNIYTQYLVGPLDVRQLHFQTIIL